MSSTAVIVLVVIIVVLLAVGLILAQRASRRRRLRERFGPEYDRMMADRENPREVEQELADREKRHKELPIRALPADARDRYAREWLAVQERFVDAPAESVGEAHRLVTSLMNDRGYPTENFDQQLADLSVEHAHTLDQYREAHVISDKAGDGTATTEELRRAMVHYRALFEELLGDQVRSQPTTNG
jgi:hypothetical protein